MLSILNTEKKSILLRRVWLTAVLVAASMLQNTAGLLPDIFGARAMLLLPAAVCVAMFEREITGTLFGVFAGLLWDMSAPDGASFNAVMFAFIGFACGMLIKYLMRNNLVTALLLCSVFTVLYLLGYWLRIYVFGGGFKGALSLFTFYLPSGIYTILWLPVFYFITRHIMKKYG
jgi:rod shape-determining protein MreD